MYKTYNEIIDTFKDLCDRHLQINTFVNNHPLEINSGDNTIYPVLAIYPGINTMTMSSVIIPIKMFIMDIQKNDYTTETEIQSDCMQIGLDFISELNDNESLYGFFIDPLSTTIENFGENIQSSEDSDISDDVAGCFFEFNIEVINNLNDCVTPFVPLDYSALFNISYDSVPISNASITISGITQNTDEYGQTTFTGLLNDTYNYSIVKSGYITINGSFIIDNDDINIGVHLEATLNPSTYTAFFTVLDENSTPVENVEVEVGGVEIKQTNEEGMVEFNELIDNTYNYIVFYNGEEINDSFEIKGNDVNIDISF